MIVAMKELIEEARRMAKSKRAPARERLRWTRLAGQLIWYKDAILRSMSLESMEMEMVVLKKEVFTKHPENAPHGYHPPKAALPRNPSIRPPE